VTIDKLSSSDKFAKNSIYNVIGFIVTFPILILLTPYMLNVLGKAKFGVWAIAGVVTSYAQLSDMGMSTAIVKFVAEYWVKEEVGSINKVVSNAFFSFAVVGGILASSVILARHYIVVNLLKVPLGMQLEALFVVSGITIIFYFNLLFSVYNSVLLGIQRMDVTNGIMIISKTFRALGMWAFLAAGMGLKGLIWNSAIFSLFTIALNVFFAKRLLSDLKLNPSLVSFSELKEITKYSSNIFSAKLMGLFQDPINKVILAVYTSLPFVSLYEVGWRVNSMVRSLFGIALMPLLPASSELQSKSNKQELEKIYLSVSRMLYLFVVPFFLVVMVFAKPLIQVWLGDGYELAGRAIQFLLLGNLFSLLVTPQYIILQGLGKPHINTIAHGLAAGINVVLSIVLTYYIGFFGVLIGGVVSLLVSSLFIDCLFRRIVGIDVWVYLHQISIVGIFTAFMLSGSLMYASIFVYNWNIGKLILFVMGFFLVYLAILRIGGVTDKKDTQLLMKLLKVVRITQ